MMSKLCTRALVNSPLKSFVSKGHSLLQLSIRQKTIRHPYMGDKRRQGSKTVRNPWQQGSPVTGALNKAIGALKRGQTLYKGTPVKNREKVAINELIDPKPVNIPFDHEGVGEDLTGKLDFRKVLQALDEFKKRESVRKVAAANQLKDEATFQTVYSSFRLYIRNNIGGLPADLHVLLTDITEHNSASVDGLIPYFLNHALEIYPHLEFMDDLKKTADLQKPANWYMEARELHRKIIFHVGPTNSGKTYHALKRFKEAKRGLYCGPLRLLAQECFKRLNEENVPCDLVTGEEVRIVNPDGSPASHIACTVEIMNTHTHYDVAVIDEIQMIRDPVRGAAWTRALLGVCADEVHLCGEQAAIPIVQKLINTTGDQLEIQQYQRLTKLSLSESAIGTFKNIQPGDCIVAFSKKDIYKICLDLEKLGIEAAVIYGGLPPATKRAQAELFNDPKSTCKVLVSTDAIGMGINLSIKRMVFYSLTKFEVVQLDNGETVKMNRDISTSQALQIAGRAGRYGSAYNDGEVTTFRELDYSKLKEILGGEVETIERAGLQPSPEQLETFSWFLGDSSLSKIIDIFSSLTEYDDCDYFLCKMEDFKQLSETLDNVDLSLRSKYVFCMAPVTKDKNFTSYMYLMYARRYSKGIPTKFDFIVKRTGHPYSYPGTLEELSLLEEVYASLELYCWLSYRFNDMFPDRNLVMKLQEEIEPVIRHGVLNITKLRPGTDIL